MNPEGQEAKRLIKIFGLKATNVVEEIMKYDAIDTFFWLKVKEEVYKQLNEKFIQNL